MKNAMTVIVVFALVGCCGKSRLPGQTEYEQALAPMGGPALVEGLSLPSSRTAAASLPEGVDVQVSSSAIFVADVKVAEISDGTAEAQEHVIAGLKDMVLEQVQNEKAMAKVKGDEFDGLTVRLMVDQKTSGRLLKDVLNSIYAGQAEKVVLVSSGQKGIPLVAPEAGSGDVKLIVVDDGDAYSDVVDDLDTAREGGAEKLAIANSQ